MLGELIYQGSGKRIVRRGPNQAAIAAPFAFTTFRPEPIVCSYCHASYVPAQGGSVVCPHCGASQPQTAERV